MPTPRTSIEAASQSTRDGRNESISFSEEIIASFKTITRRPKEPVIKTS
jgi:hypothetical protein